MFERNECRKMTNMDVLVKFESIRAGLIRDYQNIAWESVCKKSMNEYAIFRRIAWFAAQYP